MRNLLLGITGLAFCMSLNACKQDSRVDARSRITGYWKLEKGFRDEKETESLSGTFFQFSENNTMTTNLIPGADLPQAFSVEKNKITQKATPPITYTVEEAGDSTMTMSVKIRGIDFRFLLKRGMPEPETPVEGTSDEIDSTDTGEIIEEGEE